MMVMMQSNNSIRMVVVSVVAAMMITGMINLCNVHSFSPSARSSAAQVSQIVEERQRFYPQPQHDGTTMSSPSSIVQGDDDFFVEHDAAADTTTVTGAATATVTNNTIATTEEESIRNTVVPSSHTTSSSSSSSSVEYQIASLTERVTYLTRHLRYQPTDFSTRRGLIAMLNKRRRILHDLYEDDPKRYVDIVKSLGIRHRNIIRLR